MLKKTFYEGPQGFLKNVVHVIDTFFSGPQRSIETNISKNGCFHGDKNFWLFFPRDIGCDKPQATSYKSTQAKFTITVEHIRAFFKESRRLLQT